MSDRDGGNSFVWFLAGLGLGTLVGVLYAPRSGSETREALASALRKVAIMFAAAHARLVSRLHSGQTADAEVLNQQKEQFRAAYEAGRQAYHETTAETGAPKSL